MTIGRGAVARKIAAAAGITAAGPGTGRGLRAWRGGTESHLSRRGRDRNRPPAPVMLRLALPPRRLLVMRACPGADGA